jgi:GTPase SAR1 family protein
VYGNEGLEGGAMTGLEGPVAGAVVKLVIERAGPAGLKLVSSWIHGKSIAVVGPPRAGKSTFLSYLQYGIFLPEEETDRTYTPTESPRFNLHLGPNRNLSVQIKTAIDMPGPNLDVADYVYHARPHALLIVLDLTASLDDPNDLRASAIWLNDFLARFDQLWRGAKPKRNRLRTIIVAMNKIDKVDQATRDAFEARYREIVDRRLIAAKGSKVSAVHFKPSVMVENPEGTRWVDTILVDMAKSLVSEK